MAAAWEFDGAIGPYDYNGLEVYDAAAPMPFNWNETAAKVGAVATLHIYHGSNEATEFHLTAQACREMAATLLALAEKK